MVKAFVFGKFYPLHKGHEDMIRFALQHSGFLSVLVCSSDKETIPGKIRQTWISQTFKDYSSLEVLVFNYREEELPNTSESSEIVSRIWSTKFKELFPDHNLLITSEPYGEIVARYMNIRHLAFDPERRSFPVSASALRNNLFSNWSLLSISARSYFSFKIVLLGTESTGKTVLAKRLSDYFRCTLVPETGREMIANSNTFIFEDLQKVAEVHAKRIQEAVCGESPLVIIDTDIHTTMSYAEFIFHRSLPVSELIREANKSSLYLYLNNDTPFIQDGTRLSESRRNLLDLSHRKILKKNNISFVEVSGDWEDRFKSSVMIIKKHLKQTELSGFTRNRLHP